MPYIRHERRGLPPENAGELNYAITSVIVKYLFRKTESYQNYNDVLGVLTAIQHELYARKITPYESQKMASNGDVFEPL